MRRLWHIFSGLGLSLALVLGPVACDNNNTAPAPINTLPPGTIHQSPPAEQVLVQFTQLARAGDLDALARVLQDVFAAGGFDELVDALSVVLDSERVEELAQILDSLIDRGTIFQFTPIVGDMLIILSADRDPATPGVQSSWDILSQLFETGALTELIVPIRNLLAPEFPNDNPFVSDPRIEVINIQLQVLENLGQQGLQDVLDQLNLGVIPFSEILSPRQAFLLRGGNGSVALFTNLSGTQVDVGAGTPPTVPLVSTVSAFRLQNTDLLPTYPTSNPCTPSALPASAYQRSYKARFLSGANAGRSFNVAQVDSATQLSICDTAFDLREEYRVAVTSLQVGSNYTVTINGTPFTASLSSGETAADITADLVADINGGPEPVTAFDLGGTLTVRANAVSTPFTASVGGNLSLATLASVTLVSDASFRFDILASVPKRDSSGALIGHSRIPVGAAFYAPHGVGSSGKNFVEGQIQAGDQLRLVSGLNSGLVFSVTVNAADTLDPTHQLYGDVLYLGTFAQSGAAYRGLDLAGGTDYLIAERRDPTLAFQLTDLNLVRDVLPIIERVVSGQVTPDSETLVELLLLVDLVPGSEFSGDDFVNALEVFTLASVRTDSNRDGLFDAVDNLDRNRDGGCRNPTTGNYVFWEQGLDNLCAADFMDVNNDGVVQEGENFDVNGDGVFDVSDFSRSVLLATANCERAKYFDTERIQSQGPGACPPGDGYVDCDLFSDPLNCRTFDTNNDGKLDSFDQLPAVLDRAGRVVLANGFSIPDRYPDGAPDGRLDWRDILNSRSITPSSFITPSPANPFNTDDNLPRFAQASINSILDILGSDAGISMRRGAEALIFALDNPANLFIEGRALPLVLLEDLGRLVTTTDLNTGEFLLGPAIETIYALMTNGPKAYDGIHGSYEPRYLPVMLSGVAIPQFSQKGSSLYRATEATQTLIEPITSVGGFGGPRTFPYGTFELLFKHIFAELACSDPSVRPADCLAADPNNFLISGIERDPVGNINQSAIRYVTADDDRPFEPASGSHPYDAGRPLPRALPFQACPGGVCADAAFLNQVVNNTSGGDIDNVFTFADPVYPDGRSDFRPSVPGDFLVISAAPFEDMGVVCDDPTLVARVAGPELGIDGMPVQPVLNCDQFQTFQFPGGKQSIVVLSPLQASTAYNVVINGMPVSYTSDADPTASEVSAGLAAAIDAAGAAFPPPAPPWVTVFDRGGIVQVETDTQGTAFTLVSGDPTLIEIADKIYKDATVDVDVIDPIAVAGVNEEDELIAICGRTRVVCLRILQVISRDTVLIGLDNVFEDDANSNGIADDQEVGAVDPGDLSPFVLQPPLGVSPTPLYYGYLANYLDRLPREVFQLYQFHQEGGHIPTFDGLEPNFDFSNVDSSLALANSPPHFRASIAQELTLALPILDIEYEMPIHDADDLRALDLSALTGPQQALVCPSGSVPLLSCGSAFVTNPFREVNGGLPDDQVLFQDPAVGKTLFDIPSVYDDRILCVPGTLASLPAAIEVTNLIGAFDPSTDPCRSNPELPGCETGSAFPAPAASSRATICANPLNQGPPAAPGTLGEYEIRRVANVLARLIPQIAGINPKTAEQLIDDTQSLTAPLLAGGVLTEQDQEALLTSLDAVAAAARTGLVPTLARLGEIVARPNLENVDVQTATIETARILTDTTQLDNGEIFSNRVVLKELEPILAAFFSPDTQFGEDLIFLLLALESIPVSTVDNYVRVEQPDLGAPCDPNISTLFACANRNVGPDLTADFVRAMTKPQPLTTLDGDIRKDIDNKDIPVRPADGLLIAADDFLALAVDCIHGVDQYGNGTPVFNCASVEDPSGLTPFGIVLRDMVVILGGILQSEDFSTELLPFFASVLRTVVDLLQPQRGDRIENPTLSALRLFLSDSALEAGRQVADATEALNQSDRSKLLSFLVDQFDPDTGAIAGLIDATDPIIRNDPDGVFARAVSELLEVNPTLPPILCSNAQSIAGRLIECYTKVLNDVPDEDRRFLFDTYVELVDTGSAEVIVNILAQLVTTGALERLTPTLLLMVQEGVLNEFIVFQGLILANGTIGVDSGQ